MNPSLLLPIGIVFMLMLFGLAGAGKQTQVLGLWVDRLDGPQTATASALAPIIDCMNRVDRDTRLTYQRAAHPPPAQAGSEPEVQTSLPVGRYARAREEFGDNNEPQARLIQNDVCAPTLTAKLEHQQPDSPLIGMTAEYLSSLQKITSTLSASSQVRVFGGAMQQRFEEDLSRNGHTYTALSSKLRNALTLEEQRLRPAQLALLEARLGRDLHWQLLDYMITARQAVNQIDSGVREASLTPKALAALTTAVQRANERSAAFVDNIADKNLNDEALHLWYTLRAPADDYLKALQNLLQDWLDHAPPQQLSDDYYLVTRRYDALLSYYNRPARNAF
ncbi:DUF3829 domain-containing protein [Pseudomonas antarctica]|uniref:DUF3829 domain-containing protein n=1 Tax=Pseudomonas antarctica TaxID=219572 RepID=UPI00387B2D38